MTRLRIAATLALATAIVSTSFAASSGLAAPLAVAASASTPAEPPTETGEWQVIDLGNGQFEVTWTAPDVLPLTSDRPEIVGPDGPLGATSVAADGRTVSVLVSTDQAPDPADLDVRLAGDRLDEAGREPAGGDPGTSQAPARETLPTDPGQPGEFDVVTSDYERDPVKLPGMKQPIEMVGHVVEPAAAADTGKRPLVVFLHGRHAVCYAPDGNGNDDPSWPCAEPLEEIPSHQGYDYLQRVLASQGYATVSIRVNGINAQDYALDDGGADARAAMLEQHLDYLAGRADQMQLELSRVVLVGHSRGGEGVDRASIQLPLSAPYRIAGQVLIAPTDFAAHTAPYVPTVTLLPYCDGDVSDLQGQRFTDTSRDLTTGDTSLKSSVLVMGANHNYFNTEWTPGLAAAPANDDWWGPQDETCGRRHPGRLSPTEQQAVGTAYVAGAVRLFADDEQELLPLYDGSDARVESTGDAVMLSHAIGGGRDLRRPGIDAQLVAGSGEGQLCLGRYGWSDVKPQECGRFAYEGQMPHWTERSTGPPVRRALDFGWTAAGQSEGLRFTEPLDTTGGRLELRTIVDQSRGDVGLKLNVTDTAGASVEVTPVGGGELTALPAGEALAKRWAQTVIVDPADLAGIDASAIARIDLVGTSGEGRVFVLDVASAPTSLAPVPDRRLPLISVDSVVLDEGDGEPGQEFETAHVPLSISGEVTEPARIVVITSSDSRGGRNRLTIDIEPGQQEVTVPVAYRADDAYSEQQQFTIVAYAVRGVATDDYQGRVTIREDDPRPEVSATAPKRVVEGKPVTVELGLSAPITFPLIASIRFRKPSGEPVRFADLPAKWVRKHFGEVNPNHPIYRGYGDVSATIRPGDLTGSVSIPVRRDRLREGRERMRVEVTFYLPDGREVITRPVVVQPSR